MQPPGSPTTYYLLPTTYYLLPLTYYHPPPTTYYLLPTSYYLLPTPYSLLPTTYYLLPTTYYLLPTSASKGYAATRLNYYYFLLPQTQNLTNLVDTTGWLHSLFTPTS